MSTSGCCRVHPLKLKLKNINGVEICVVSKQRSLTKYAYTYINLSPKQSVVRCVVVLIRIRLGFLAYGLG